MLPNLSPSCVPVFLTHPLSELPGAGPLAGNSFEFTAPPLADHGAVNFFLLSLRFGRILHES